MRRSRPTSTLRRFGALGGIPLLALALGAGEPSACRDEGTSARGSSTSVHRSTARPRAVRRPRPAPAPVTGPVEKRSGSDPALPPSTVHDQRRGGVGTLIGITFA